MSIEPGGIAIVGMAGVFPGAPDVTTFWRNICAGVDAIGDVPSARLDPAFFDGLDDGYRLSCRRGGFVDDVAIFDPARFGIMPVTVDGTEPDQLLAIAVAAQALADAGEGVGLPGADRVGVILGRGGYLTPGVARLDQRVRTARQVVATLAEVVPGLAPDVLDQVQRAFVDQVGATTPDSAIGLVPNLTASRIANRLDLHGPAYVVDAACASSLLAVDHGVRELESGRCDLVLAGGVHHCHDVTLWSVFSQLGALSPSEQIRPFSRHADGLLIGEGTGVVVLKRLADAERDSDRVYAVVRGTGVASDGRAASLMSPAVEGQVRSIERAWTAAGLDPATVGLIEAHGTATTVGDEAELDTLTRAFGTTGDPIGVGSVKSMIGHAMPASGIAGLIKAAYAVHDAVRPPTLHCDEPHPAFAGGRLRPQTTCEPWETTTTPRRAGVNAFGFGGINAHVVLEAHAGSRSRRHRPGGGEPHRARSTAREPSDAAAGAELLVFSAESIDELERRLGDDATACRPDPVGAPAAGPVRLAIAEPTERRLATARKILARGRAWRGRNDVWFAPDEGLLSRGGRIGYLFPGIEPVFDPDIEGIARWFGIEPPDLSWGSDLEAQGYGVIAVSRVLTEVLDALGVHADVMAGHSIGEWSAMIASGCVPPHAVDAFLDDLDPGNLVVPDMLYVALGCSAEVAAAALVGFDDVAVSHDNCPHQSIICGREAAVRAALERLNADRVLGQELPFRSGFHSPMFAAYLDPFRENLAQLALADPDISLWSATTVAPFPDDDADRREVALRLYTEPVRFRELVEALYDDGVRAFVQPGTGSVTGFVDDILGERDALSVPLLRPKRTGLAQLERAAAALWVEGAAVDLDRLPSRHQSTPSPEAGRAAESLAAPAPSGRPLRLGSSLVRLGDDAPQVSSGGTRARAGGPTPDHPLLTEFDAVLQAADAAGLEVLEAWDRAHHRPRGTYPPSNPAVVSPAPPSPDPAPMSVVRRELSVAAEPALVDHTFYRQPDGRSLDERFPVVPMTMILELMASAALEACPGRTVIGLENVRALRWLAVEPAVDVEIRAEPQADDRVKVTVDGYARGVVVLGDSWPEPPPPSLGVRCDEQPSNMTAREMYDQRWMFHGPAYQAVVELTGSGTDGIRGRLRDLPAPGALLDAAGQLFGYWVIRAADRDYVAFPMRIDAVRYFGAAPVPGDEVDCVVEIDRFTDADVAATLELTRDGGVWCRIEGWVDRRFESDDALFSVFQWPEREALGEVLADDVVLVREPCRDTASRELLMRRYLDRAEREVFESLTPRVQRDWLVGRIAVKDAVRRWLWRQGAGDLFPIEITVDHDERGRPIVSGPFDDDLRVSLAHKDAVGVAAVAEGHDVGVDLEVVDERGDRFADLALSAAEQAVLAPLDDERVTRAWAAKEAAAKAAGTGLQGRPRDFPITAIDDEHVYVADRPFTTTRRGDVIVCWTTPDR